MQVSELIQHLKESCYLNTVRVNVHEADKI